MFRKCLLRFFFFIMYMYNMQMFFHFRCGPFAVCVCLVGMICWIIVSQKRKFFPVVFFLRCCLIFFSLRSVISIFSYISLVPHPHLPSVAWSHVPRLLCRSSPLFTKIGACARSPKTTMAASSKNHSQLALHIFKLVHATLCVALTNLAQRLVLVTALAHILTMNLIVDRFLGLVT